MSRLWPRWPDVPPSTKRSELPMQTQIYHNPKCGTSRNTLAMIEASGETPEIIEYLLTPPTRARLVELIAMMGMSPRARSEEHTSELQSRGHLVCRLLLEKKKPRTEQMVNTSR